MDDPEQPGPGKSILSRMIMHPQPNDEEAQRLKDSSGADDHEDFNYVTVGRGIISQPQETTPLLRVTDVAGVKRTATGRALDDKRSWQHGFGLSKSWGNCLAASSKYFSPKRWDRARLWGLVTELASCLPAVLLGLLLNVLDALSYGMILFPLSQPIFSELGPDGLSMFYVSCIASQLVYSLGGSIFKGSIGSEMIEVVPFFHKMAFTIMHRVGEDRPRTIVATTILSYSLSAILTGLVFWLMGQCRLGSLIGFFPRHILIGCIGGVGFFLIITVCRSLTLSRAPV